MQSLSLALISGVLPLAIVLFALAAIIWLFFNHGIDKLRHPEEWKDAGKSGEQIVYRVLVDKFHVPEAQILRNVYIPTSDGKTSEIDLLVVSKKGLLVFECKNYGGNIYGDAKRPKWIQYLGRKKSYFYNPIMQNRSHAKHLREFLSEFGDLPIVPMVATITRGNWKVKNLAPDDYMLGVNCHLKDILSSLPDSELMAQSFAVILAKMSPLARPGDEVRQKHIEDINDRHR
ncbi:MAG: nuclease-related domain-containing protein [Candidatus Nanosyncoccaceae bacterium]